MKKKAKKTTAKPVAKKVSKKSGKSAPKKMNVSARKSAVGKKTSPAKQPAASKVAVSAPVDKKAKPARKLSAKVLDEFRDLLIALRGRLSGQIASLKGDSLLRHDAVNTEEDGTDAFERQFALNLASSETDSLLEIDDSLRKMDDGSYGICEHCECNIELPRLKALPFARNCVRCQSEMEKNGQHLNSAATRRGL